MSKNSIAVKRHITNSITYIYRKKQQDKSYPLKISFLINIDKTLNSGNKKGIYA